MRFCVAVFVLLTSASISHAQMDVFLNFDPDWINNLNDLTSSAGVSSFNSTETDQIESIIESEFNRVFTEFDLTFFTPDNPPPPTAAFTTIDYGAITGSSGLLGSAPGDFFNVGVVQTANVFTANFDFFIDEFSGSNNRSQQINQVATALAGTGAHELGHSVGLFHVHSYGTQGITPANYSNTLGLQNGNIMATGSTGLSESERETQRVLSQFSKLAMEAAGGLDASLHGFTGTALANVVLQETDFLNVDAGKSFITASQLQLEAMPISGLDAVHVHSDITSVADADFYQVDLAAPGFLSAQIVSRRFPTAPDFDAVISVFDADENLLISFDASRYSGDQFGTGTLRTEDPFIANLELDSAGTYYIQVTSTANDSSGNYSLLIGVDSISVPEPASGGVLVTAVAMLILRRRKRA